MEPNSSSGPKPPGSPLPPRPAKKDSQNQLNDLSAQLKPPADLESQIEAKTQQALDEQDQPSPPPPAAGTPLSDKTSDHRSLPLKPKPTLPPSPFLPAAGTQQKHKPPVVVDQPSTPQAPRHGRAQKSTSIFKYLFFISLIIFLTVTALVVYTLLNQQQNLPFLPKTPTPVPTVTQASPTSPSSACELNDQIFPVGQSFPAADGCNTCTCQSDLTISCTQDDCSLTPSPATESSQTL